MNVRRIVIPCVIAASVAASPSAFSWNDTGHMVIAAIARRDLKPQARMEITRLIQLGDDPKSDSYMTAACWADDHRTKTSAPWHYINYHFRPDGGLTENKPDEQNILVAIKRFSVALGDKRRMDSERAEALRYILHFVGDVHQPLHAVARDTDEHPDGDRGGNLFKIEPPAGWTSSVPDNLHALWDSGCGLLPPEHRPLEDVALARIDALAAKLMSAHPKVSFERWDDADPQAWAQESLDVAKTVVYDLKEGQAPDEAYLKRGREAAEKRLVLAGYRLGALLNRLLGK